MRPYSERPLSSLIRSHYRQGHRGLGSLCGLNVFPQHMGYAVAYAHDGHAGPVRHQVEEGLHLLDVSTLLDDLLQGSSSTQEKGNEAAGQLGYSVLKA